MAIINSGAIIEHECRIGQFVHVAPGATLCGRVCVEDHTHIGANATILPSVHIGKHVMVGAGSVVLHNLNDRQKVAGNPARNIR